MVVRNLAVDGMLRRSRRGRKDVEETWLWVVVGGGGRNWGL